MHLNYHTVITTTLYTLVAPRIKNSISKSITQTSSAFEVKTQQHYTNVIIAIIVATKSLTASL